MWLRRLFGCLCLCTKTWVTSAHPRDSTGLHSSSGHRAHLHPPCTAHCSGEDLCSIIGPLSFRKGLTAWSKSSTDIYIDFCGHHAQVLHIFWKYIRKDWHQGAALLNSSWGEIWPFPWYYFKVNQHIQKSFNMSMVFLFLFREGICSLFRAAPFIWLQLKLQPAFAILSNACQGFITWLLKKNKKSSQHKNLAHRLQLRHLYFLNSF